MRQSDLAGNTSANGQLGSITIDTSAPTAPALALASDTGSSNSDGITNNGTVNVTGLEAGASWQYSTNGGSSWLAGTGASFFVTPGTYTTGKIRLRQSDIAGNTSGTAQLGTITVDTSAPTSTSAISAVNDNVGLIQGNLAADAVSDDTTPTISGTISAALATGESLRIFNGTTLLGSATVNNTAKTWSFTPTALPNTAGTPYAITARVVDAAGNLGTASTSFSFSLDTSTPTTTAAITAVNDNVGLIQGNLAASAVSDDDTPTISGTISAALATGETLRISNGATFLGLATVDNATLSWSYTPPLLSTSGTSYAITARVADAAGNLGTASASFSFSLDTSAPAVTAAITAVNDNVGLIQGNLVASAVSDDVSPTISGTISAALATGESLRIFNGTTLLGSATVNNTAKTWSFTPTALPNTAGTPYAITARVADAAGNLGTASASFSFSLDTSAPATTAAITAVNDDLGLIKGNLAADALSDDVTPTISGTISAALATGETLRISNGDIFLGLATVDNANLSWSYTPSLPSTSGTSYAITARVADAAGNLGAASASFSFSLDTSAPAVTAAITAVNDNLGLIQGNLAADAVSDDTTPTISGTISAALATGETLRIYNGESFLGLATVDNANLSWSYTPPLPSTAGTSYAITARVADAAGNLGTASASFSFSLDTSAPTVIAAITAVNDNVGLIQGNLAASAVGDDTTPTISGSISAALANGDSLRIYNGSTFLGLASVDNANLSWSYTPTLSSTAGTSYAITARVADAAGNLGTASASFSFSLDTSAPAVTAEITAVNDNVGLIRGNLAADAVSDDVTPTITGTISAALASGDRLRIYNGDNFLGIASVNNTAKTWSYRPTLPSTSGTSYSISARVADAAGNLGTASTSFSFSIDTSAPAATAAITAVNDNFGLIQGNLAAGAVCDDVTPTISGTISAPLASGETLRISNRANFLGLATVDNDTLTWSYTPTLPSTAGTSYAISARVVDAAGNLGTASTSFSFSLDTSASAVTAAITAVNDNVGLIRGSLAADAVSDDATPTITGTISTALATGDRLRIYNGDSFLGIASVNNTAKTWSFTPTTPVANGFYAVSARVSDVAGNLGAVSPLQRFSIDSTSNQLIGTATANTLTATTAKDMLTGLGGIDTFSFTALSRSTLVNFDRITDFAIGTDVLDGPNAITAADINKLGLADSLDASSISTLLTSSTFFANKAATFSYGDPSGISRSFIALNDGFSGYSASNDAIIEITGYTGLLANLFVS